MTRTLPAIALAVAVTVSGCSGTKASSSGPPATPSPTTIASPTETPDDSALVKQVVVTAADAGPGLVQKVPQGGDKVTDEVTLDVCGARFPSESLRTARLQVVYERGGTAVASNEVVTYQAGGTAQARTEVLHAVTSCPHHPVTSDVAGVPPLTYTLTPLPSRAGWPTGTLAYLESATDGKQTQKSIGIFMWHGHVFSGVYGPADAAGSPSSSLLALSDAAAKNISMVS